MKLVYEASSSKGKVEVRSACERQRSLTSRMHCRVHFLLVIKDPANGKVVGGRAHIAELFDWGRETTEELLVAWLAKNLSQLVETPCLQKAA